jgi:hypothetical protein
MQRNKQNAGNNRRGQWLMVKKIPAITLVLWATPKQPPVKKLTAVCDLLLSNDAKGI